MRSRLSDWDQFPAFLMSLSIISCLGLVARRTAISTAFALPRIGSWLAFAVLLSILLCILVLVSVAASRVTTV
jgi:hypothetical protein